ncbi:thioesterase II family protein [Kribbella antibiotica]|uniref:thioesterase II family protein n=1 Tax=Kribbella antibiotica TaxID=190195 RepID=UPI0014053AE6|nr:alpha/beta fold hydrolase [Kribbella antibiotica]
MSTTWIRSRAPRPAARLRLICLPHAGGAANFFQDWHARIPDDIEVLAVQYPGRWERTGEPLLESMDELAAAVAAEIRPLADRPIAVFGHSMGSIAAYEVTRRLAEWGIEPAHLFVSGRYPPSEQKTSSVVHLLDDDGLAEELIRLGGMPAELLADQDMRDYFLPIIRSDYRLIETYQWSPGPEPKAPMTILYGDSDANIGAEQAERWRAHSAGEVTVRRFPGGHFYLVPQRDAVLEYVVATLS